MGMVNALLELRCFQTYKVMRIIGAKGDLLELQEIA